MLWDQLIERTVAVLSIIRVNNRSAYLARVAVACRQRCSAGPAAWNTVRGWNPFQAPLDLRHQTNQAAQTRHRPALPPSLRACHGYLGNGHRKVKEGIKAVRLAVAPATRHCGLQLPPKDVLHQRVLPAARVRSRLRRLLLNSALALQLLVLRLALDTIALRLTVAQEEQREKPYKQCCPVCVKRTIQ